MIQATIAQSYPLCQSTQFTTPLQNRGPSTRLFYGEQLLRLLQIASIYRPVFLYSRKNWEWLVYKPVDALRCLTGDVGSGSRLLLSALPLSSPVFSSSRWRTRSFSGEGSKIQVLSSSPGGATTMFTKTIFIGSRIEALLGRSTPLFGDSSLMKYGACSDQSWDMKTSIEHRKV